MKNENADDLKFERPVSTCATCEFCRYEGYPKNYHICLRDNHIMLVPEIHDVSYCPFLNNYGKMDELTENCSTCRYRKYAGCNEYECTNEESTECELVVEDYDYCKWYEEKGVIKSELQNSP